MWKAINEWRQRRTLSSMFDAPLFVRGLRSTGQLDKSIGADRATILILRFHDDPVLVGRSQTSYPGLIRARLLTIDE